MKKIIFLILIVILLTPVVSFAQNQTIGERCPINSTSICDPTGAGNLPNFAMTVARMFGFMVGWTAIIMVMFSGFRMIIAQGNEEDLTKARSALQWSLSGFVLVLAAYLIVYATTTFLGGKTRFDESGLDDSLNPLKHNTFGELFSGMITNFLQLSGLLAILFIIVNGFRYITSRGNEEAVGTAKQGLTWSVIGLVIVLLAYTLVVATAKFFGANVTN